MISPLRTRMNGVLAGIPASRRPTLKRCDAPHALLATNLPFVAHPDAVEAFIRRVTEDGWRVEWQGSWLLLDADIPAPDAPIPEALMGTCGCCISLLLRHPSDDASAEDAIRAIVKAEEAGQAHLERCCTQLHAQWAERLRCHQPLPAALLPYLCHAHHILKEAAP